MIRTGSRLLALGVALSVLAATADAQAVSLRIHPRAGDTLHTRLEQQTEVSSAGEDGDSRGRPLATSVVIDSRTIVQSSLATSTVVLTIVDSADMHTSDVHGADQIAAAERMLRGQRLLLQLAMDGSVENARDAGGRPVPRDFADAMAAMPAVFPRYPVRVGDSWAREMPLPSSGPLGARGMGYVSARFRLDSLGRGGRIAFVSMRGDIKPSSTSDGVQLTGAIRGTMQLDRTRGWMTDSQVTVLVRSFVTPPAGTGRAPMRFITRVTQRLRTMDKR
ncbi:MAG TPA: hypothetical protein VFY85_13770 [Gemmatimonadaceae bacterium]|nr:hypothetical protein [Gemmatimonadaceae bacterium]